MRRTPPRATPSAGARWTCSSPYGERGYRPTRRGGEERPGRDPADDRRLQAEPKLAPEQRLPPLEPPRDLPGRERAHVQYAVQASRHRLRHEHAEAPGAPVQLVRHAGEAELTGAALVGEAVDRAAAEPEREVHAEHGGAGGEVEQEAAGRESDLGRERVLHPGGERGVVGQPGLGAGGDVARREVHGALVEAAGADRAGKGAPVGGGR